MRAQSDRASSRYNGWSPANMSASPGDAPVHPSVHHYLAVRGSFAIGPFATYGEACERGLSEFGTAEFCITECTSPANAPMNRVDQTTPPRS